MGTVTGCLMSLSSGLRLGSKLMMRILGVHPSRLGVWFSSTLADRFRLRDPGGEDEDGDEDDISPAREMHSASAREMGAVEMRDAQGLRRGRARGMAREERSILGEEVCNFGGCCDVDQNRSPLR
jgi:hypothetical protein